MKKRFILVLSVVMLFTMVACGNEGENVANDNQEELVVTDEEVGDEEDVEEVEIVEKEAEVVEVESEEIEEADDVPREYKAALKKAEVYVNQMHMSKLGVYDQLVSEYGENFPAEAAKYAIDNLQADWKQAALKKAEVYANEMNMSDAAVYDQLVSEYGEKFTPEEAQYAVDNLE